MWHIQKRKTDEGNIKGVEGLPILLLLNHLTEKTGAQALSSTSALTLGAQLWNLGQISRLLVCEVAMETPPAETLHINKARHCRWSRVASTATSVQKTGGCYCHHQLPKSGLNRPLHISYEADRLCFPFSPILFCLKECLIKLLFRSSASFFRFEATTYSQPCIFLTSSTENRGWGSKERCFSRGKYYSKWHRTKAPSTSHHLDTVTHDATWVFFPVFIFHRANKMKPMPQRTCFKLSSSCSYEHLLVFLFKSKKK